MAATSTPATGDVVLAWFPVAGATQYKAELSNSPSFSVTYYTTALTSALRATPIDPVPPGTWYWRAAAVDASGASEWTVAPSFVRSAIAGPTGLTPGAGSPTTIQYPSAPVFSWNPMPNVESYTVEWSTSDTFPGGSQTGTTASTSFVPPAQLTRGQPWYWRVRGKTSGTNLPTQWSVAGGGITVDWPNAAPALVAPANDPAGVTPVSDVQLSWSPVSGAAFYRVDVATDSAFSSASRLANSPFPSYSTTWAPPRSFINGAYFWRVSAVDPLGNDGPASGYRQFTRAWGPTSAPTMPAGQLVAAPTGLSPASGSSVLLDNFELRWNAVPRATAYEVWVSSETNPATLFTDGTKIMKCNTQHTRMTSFTRMASYTASWASTLQKFSATSGCVGSLGSGAWPFGQPLYWRVRAIDLGASETGGYHPNPPNPIYSQWSDRDVVASAPTITVTSGHSIAPAAGYDPPLTSPADGASVTQTPELVWAPAANATAGYWVQIGIDESFTNPIAQFHTNSTRLRMNGGLLDNSTGQQYFWRVGGCDSFASFSVRNCSTPTGLGTGIRRFAKASVTPVQNLAVSAAADQLTFSWDEHLARWPSGESTRGYELQVAHDALFSSPAPGFSSLRVDQPFAPTSAALLQDGSYFLRVRAIDGIAEGLPWSATVALTKTAPLVSLDAPASPQPLAPTLRWSPLPGSAKYDVQVLSQDGAQVQLKTGLANPAFTPTVVSPPGTYSWRVRRIDASNNVLPWTTAVGSPAAFVIGIGDVALSAPAEGAAITAAARLFTWAAQPGAVRYRLQTSTSPAFGTTVENVSTGQTSFALVDAYAAGTTYYWRVLPLNADGDVLSTPASGRTFSVLTVPGTPSATVAASGNTLIVTWIAPATGGTPIRSYALRYRVFGTTVWTETVAAADVGSMSIAGLAQSTKFEAQVSAVNALGAGPYSTLHSATTASVPRVPGSLKVTPGPGSLAVSWSTPANGGSPITGYTVRYGRVGGAMTQIQVTGNRTTLSRLAGTVAYIVDVAANNAVGRGPFASAVRATTLPGPFSVTTMAPMANPGLTGPFTARFSKPASGVSTTTMRLTMAGSATPLASTVTLSADKLTATLRPARPLQPGRTYTISLTAGIRDATRKPLLPAAWSVRASTTIQNTSPAIRESWDRDTSPAASGGGFIATATSGARSVVTFTGSSVQLLAATGPDAGTATVKIDGAVPVMINLYRPRAGFRTVVFTKAGLRNTRHTMTVTATGAKVPASKGTWVRLDAVKSGATLLQETHPSWTTSFRRVATAAASAASFDVERQVAAGDNGAKASYQATFFGSGITTYFTKTASSGRADIIIDGRKVASVDLYSAAARYRVAAFTKALANGQHTIAIVLTGAKSAPSKGTDVGLDYLLVK